MHQLTNFVTKLLDVIPREYCSHSLSRWGVYYMYEWEKFQNRYSGRDSLKLNVTTGLISLLMSFHTSSQTPDVTLMVNAC